MEAKEVNAEQSLNLKFVHRTVRDDTPQCYTPSVLQEIIPQLVKFNWFRVCRRRSVRTKCK
jgi:TolB-like protein